tara:strand:- start:336 stop:905 length:570 start_codon:yes stop_codon:yes gene_type:complete
MIIEIEKVRENTKMPVRANPSDAGLDVFFNPIDGNNVTICSNENSLLSIGCKFGVPHGYMLQVCNRSSIAAKKDLIVGAHVIDAGYDGEVFIDLHNIGECPQTIQAGDKIAQLIMVPVVHFRIREAESLYKEKIVMSNRGEGALGSTDKADKKAPSSTANLDMQDRYPSKKTDVSGLSDSLKGWLPSGF